MIKYIRKEEDIHLTALNACQELVTQDPYERRRNNENDNNIDKSTFSKIAAY